MTKLRRLKCEAYVAAHELHHWMGKFKTLAPGNAVAMCMDCGMEVQVLVNPKPNDVEIGGPAIACVCKGR